MKDKAFERAMYQIANEAQAEQQREFKMEERRKFWAKVRKGCVLVLGAAAIASGVYFREDLQGFASKLRMETPQAEKSTAAALNDIKEGAAKRDKVLDELSKK